MISRKLSPECRAYLALTSRAMLAAHGPCVLNLSREHGHRIGFLRLLEKKGALPSHILCPYCSVFHRPVVPTLWVSGDPKRLHYRAPGGRRRCEQKAASLPCDVSFSTVAAIARSTRLSLGAFPPAILDTCVRHGPEDGNRPLIRVYTSCKVVDGHVLLRTGTYLYSRSSGIHALRATARLREILNRSHGALGQICRHRRRTEAYDFILPDPNQTIGQFAEAKQVCLWSHPLGCLKQECGILPYSLSASQVCRVCPTSYLAEKKDVPGPSGHSWQRAVVVTTWHDLGPGESPYDNEWLLFKGWAYRAPVGRRYDAYDAAIRALQRSNRCWSWIRVSSFLILIWETPRLCGSAIMMRLSLHMYDMYNRSHSRGGGGGGNTGVATHKRTSP